MGGDLGGAFGRHGGLVQRVGGWVSEWMDGWRSSLVGGWVKVGRSCRGKEGKRCRVLGCQDRGGSFLPRQGCDGKARALSAIVLETLFLEIPLRLTHAYDRVVGSKQFNPYIHKWYARPIPIPSRPPTPANLTSTLTAGRPRNASLPARPPHRRRRADGLHPHGLHTVGRGRHDRRRSRTSPFPDARRLLSVKGWLF